MSTLLLFLLTGAVVAAAGTVLARNGDVIAARTGLGGTFVGTWLVGMSTSLPELVTSLAAVRLGAYDLAAGNLFGSNAFNMTAFVILDAVHHGPILSHIDQAHAVSALVAIALMSTGLAALVFRARRRLTLLEPSSGAMLLICLAGLALVYASTR